MSATTVSMTASASGSGTAHLKPMSYSRASKGQHRAYGFLPTYLRRIVKYRQMDFEYSFWLMLQLCISPKTAYRMTTYHKQTSGRWARDDPAFVLIMAVFMATAACAYCVAFGGSVGHSIYTIVSAVAIDFIGVGVGISTLAWYISNTYLRTQTHSHTVDQKVEWMYAFDVHCNSFFPGPLLLLYVLQYFLSPLLLHTNFVSCLLANLLYAAALSYYHYMTFLGYSALPFLTNTELFLYPIGAIGVVLPFAIMFGFNPSRFTLGIYFG